MKWYEFPVGAIYRVGDTFVTFVSGFYAPPDEWGFDVRSHKAEFRNAAGKESEKTGGMAINPSMAI